MRSGRRSNRLLSQYHAMEPRVKLTKNQSFQNLLANRGVPILFVVVCFLVIANTRCDQVGSANVQKFHPNGRYGRRSVGSMAEPASSHAELGRLKFGNEGSYRSVWNNINRASKTGDMNQGTQESGKFGSQQQTLMNSNESNNNQMLVADPSNLERELSKLLKCNYADVLKTTNPLVLQPCRFETNAELCKR